MYKRKYPNLQETIYVILVQTVQQNAEQYVLDRTDQRLVKSWSVRATSHDFIHKLKNVHVCVCDVVRPNGHGLEYNQPSANSSVWVHSVPCMGVKFRSCESAAVKVRVQTGVPVYVRLWYSRSLGLWGKL